MRFLRSSEWLIAVVALSGAEGCTDGDSHLGGHAGAAGTGSESGGRDSEGGSATGGKSSEGGAETAGTGGSATGGKSAEGGAESGGKSARGGAESGGKSARGGSETGGRSGGAAGGPAAGAAGAATCTPYENPVCDDDNDCAASEYCAKACAPSACGCSGGMLGCTADCRNLCKPRSTTCSAAEPAFTEQLSGEHCTVMVRISGDRSSVTGYAVNCGPLAPITEAAALNRLLPMSSINWTGATSVGNAESTHIHAFKTIFSAHLYTGFLSADTGRLLAITEAPLDGPGGFRSPIDWGDPAELGTGCAPESVRNTVVFGIDGTDFFPASAIARFLSTGVDDALRAKFGRVGPLAITNVDPPQTESVIFVTAP
ncbi:MAG TPA: hypothetical protein VG937_11765 [Polyangiaceae bacterium]|nr:hypothetical protein [Polyangiaceae bacterium]